MKAVRRGSNSKIERPTRPIKRTRNSNFRVELEPKFLPNCNHDHQKPKRSRKASICEQKVPKCSFEIGRPNVTPELRQFYSNLPPSPKVDLKVIPSVKSGHQKPNYTLVLDLDETLVHCSLEPLIKPDLKVQVKVASLNNNFAIKDIIYVKTRPHLLPFLRAAKK